MFLRSGGYDNLNLPFLVGFQLPIENIPDQILTIKGFQSLETRGDEYANNPIVILNIERFQIWKSHSQNLIYFRGKVVHSKVPFSTSFCAAFSKSYALAFKTSPLTLAVFFFRLNSDLSRSSDA